MRRTLLALFSVFISAAAFADNDKAESELPEFEPVSSPHEIVRTIRDIKSAKDILSFFHVGIQTNYSFHYHHITDTGLKASASPVTGSKINLQLNLATPLGDLVFAYNHNWMDWNGKADGRYFLSHFNFYNLHSVFGMKPLSALSLPYGTYAYGNSERMIYRQYDVRVANIIGISEVAYVFRTPGYPNNSIYHNERRISMLGLKGWITSYADFDLWNYAYGRQSSLLNDTLDDMLGDTPLLEFIPIPYFDLILLKMKTEQRYLDLVLESNDTGKFAFGGSFGLLYCRSFNINVGSGHLIIQPRIDWQIFDVGADFKNMYKVKNDVVPGTDNRLPFKTGVEASIAVNYFF